MFIKNNKFKKAVTFLAVAGLIIFPIFAFAQFKISGPPTLPGVELDEILENIIIWILGFIGILGILYLVYGGIRYVTSAGSDSEAEEAKNIITNAVIGLFVVGCSYAIVKTVVELIK